VQVFPVLPQIQNWIAHQLSRAMKRHVPTALNLELLDTAARQLGCAQGQTPGLSAATQRDDGLVFNQEQQIVFELTGKPPLSQGSLQLQHFGVRPETQVLHQQSSAHRAVPMRLTR
jgi:hypothetical protein